MTEPTTKENKKTTHSYEDDKKADLKRFLPAFGIILTIVVVVSLIFWGITSYLDKDKTTSTSKAASGLIRDYNPKYGKADSNVKLVWIYDLQCPACKASSATFKNFSSEYLDKIQIIYKAYPLPIHGMAKPAAYGAQAVFKQDPNKFLEYKDKIYEQQSQLNNETIENVAKSLDINYDTWNKDRNSNETHDLIQEDINDVTGMDLPKSDYESGNKFNATPSFAIIKDGKVQTWWSGDPGIEELKSRVDKYLK